MSRRLDIKGHNYKWMIYAVDVVILVTVFSIFVNYVVEGWAGETMTVTRGSTGTGTGTCLCFCCLMSCLSVS